MDINSWAGFGFMGVAGLVGILSLIQIAPVKIDPWSAIFKSLGRAINGEVMDKLREQDKAVESLAERVERKDAEDARNHILRFGDEIKNKVRHSEEYFNQILDDITKYESYCREHPDFKNERTAATEGVIREVYQKCLRGKDFL